VHWRRGPRRTTTEFCRFQRGAFLAPALLKAVGLILTHPLGIGAREFFRLYQDQDAH